MVKSSFRKAVSGAVRMPLAKRLFISSLASTLESIPRIFFLSSSLIISSGKDSIFSFISSGRTGSPFRSAALSTPKMVVDEAAAIVLDCSSEAITWAFSSIRFWFIAS